MPQELRLAGIHDIEAANAWLAKTYIADFNARFAITASADDDIFIPFAGDLAEILCVQEDRVVGADNGVRYGGRVLQIPEHKHRRHFARANVCVHEYPDEALAIFSGPREIARFPAPSRDAAAPARPDPAGASAAPCSRPSRPSPAGGAGAPALTAAARDAQPKRHAGMKKRPPLQPNQETDRPKP
ncbi:MAG: hypothetical protein ACOYJ6_18090 [Caulobacterales bacterium]